MADEAIRADAAIEACERAVVESPAVARLRFQLGRAYWAADLAGAALDEFLEAERLGYVPASYYLGQLHELGLTGEEGADLGAAKDFYLVAAAAGFEPAGRAWHELEAAESRIDFEAFGAPQIARIVYDGSFARLDSLTDEPRGAHRYLWAYLTGVHDLLKLDEARFAATGLDPACRRLLDPAADAALARLRRAEAFTVPRAWSEIAQELERSVMGGVLVRGLLDRAVTETRLIGTDDFFALTEYGGCGGEHVRRFYGNLRRIAVAEAARVAR